MWPHSTLFWSVAPSGGGHAANGPGSRHITQSKMNRGFGTFLKTKSVFNVRMQAVCSQPTKLKENMQFGDRYQLNVSFEEQWPQLFAVLIYVCDGKYGMCHAQKESIVATGGQRTKQRTSITMEHFFFFCFSYTVRRHRQLFEIVRECAGSSDSWSETVHYRTASPTRHPHMPCRCHPYPCTFPRQSPDALSTWATSLQCAFTSILGI